jgi:hypothetical protein
MHIDELLLKAPTGKQAQKQAQSKRNFPMKERKHKMHFVFNTSKLCNRLNKSANLLPSLKTSLAIRTTIPPCAF